MPLPFLPLSLSLPLSFPSPPSGAWEAHKTMPRAGMPTAGRAPGRRPRAGLELSPGRVAGSLSAGGQESQDEAMSDGWNHAGRSVRQESRVRGGEQGKAPGHRAPYSLGALTWGRTSAAGGWAAVAGSFSCFWDGQQKKTKKPVTGTQREWVQKWADRHRACAWGQGRQGEHV